MCSHTDAASISVRWDPSRTDPVLMLQSANLYAVYYSLQILVHRPFIMTPDITSPLAFPSLSICANAARSTARMLAIVKQRFPSKALPDFLVCPVLSSQVSSLTAVQHYAACSSGLMILLNIWTARSFGVAIDAAKEMEHVDLCMDVVKEAEGR